MNNFDIDLKKLKNAFNTSSAHFTAPLGRATGPNKIPSASFSINIDKKLNDMMGLAKSSVFFPFTKPTVKNPVTGTVYKGSMPNMNNVMKKFGLQKNNSHKRMKHRVEDETMLMLAKIAAKKRKEEKEKYFEEQIDELNIRFPVSKEDMEAHEREVEERQKKKVGQRLFQQPKYLYHKTERQTVPKILESGRFEPPTADPFSLTENPNVELEFKKFNWGKEDRNIKADIDYEKREVQEAFKETMKQRRLKGGDLFAEHLKKRGVNLSGYSKKDIKRLQTLYEKNPELIEKSKDAIIHIQPGVPFYQPRTGPGIERIKGEEVVVVDKRDYGPYELGITHQATPEGTLKHELKHKEQYETWPKKELKEREKYLIEKEDKQKKEIKEFKESIKDLPEEIQDKLKLENVKEALKNIDNMEREAVEAEKVIPERKIKPDQEEVDTAFRATVKQRLLKQYRRK